MAQTLKFGNGNFATKAGSTLCYDDQNGNFKPIPMDFTRASTATRVNKQGLIEVVKSNVPRIDYTDTTNGVLLLEKAATNLINYSEDFSNSDWSKTGLTVNANQITSPDGGLNADKVDITTANAHYLFDTISVSASTNYTFTFYVKKGTATDVSYSILNATNFTNIVNTTSYFNEISDTDWTRISVEFTTPSGCTSIRTYPLRDGSSTGTVYIWGAMLEQNSVASSYIPTQGSASTRVAETANGAGNSEVFNDSEGVLFCDISGLVDEDDYRIISLNAGNSTASIFLGLRNNTGNVYMYMPTDNTSYISNVNATNKFTKIALKYKANDVSFFINGFKVFTDNTVTLPTGLNQLDLNYGNPSNSYPFYGKTKEIAYYDTILTDLELETLTSYRTWESMVNELNLNIIYNG